MSEQEEPDGVPSSDQPRALRAVEALPADIRIDVPAIPAEVGRIRRAVLGSAAAHGVGQLLQVDIGIAVSEACANVVTHAYHDVRAPGPLTVEAYRSPQEFVVVVSDLGSGFAPDAGSPGMGVGIALIARLAHRVEISRNEPAGATLLMGFGLQG